MWSSYGPANMLVEKNIESVEPAESSKDYNLPYVVNDIATFFTLLVGIYFPSVTGKGMVTFFLLSSFGAAGGLVICEFPLQSEGCGCESQHC